MDRDRFAKRAASRLRRFAARQDGGAAVEFALIVPVFMLIAALIVDSSMLLFRQSQAYRVVQDANRSLSIGRFTTAEETSAFVTAALATMAPGTTTTSTVAGGIVTTTVRMPITGIQVTGLLTAFGEGSVGVTATHVLER